MIDQISPKVQFILDRAIGGATRRIRTAGPSLIVVRIQIASGENTPYPHRTMSECTLLRPFLLIPLAFGAVLLAQPTRPPFTKADFEGAMKELSNWGRWGTADELGALNLITPEKRREAAKLVREGIPVSLSHVAEKEKAADNPRPFVHEMLSTSATPGAQSHSDSFTVAHHGLAHTHLDALCHFFYDGRMYNGFAREEVTAKGAAKLSVFAVHNGIFTRGVLMDIPRLKGVPYLEPGVRIFPEDLEAWERKTGVRVGPGDALLLRWGRWARRAAIGPFSTEEGAAGFDVSVLPWLKKRDVALLGWETPGYVPQPAGDLPRNAVHDFALAILGIHLLDRADFEAVSEAAARRNRWEFMLTIAPLPIPNGTGSPVNPIAMF